MYARRLLAAIAVLLYTAAGVQGHAMLRDSDPQNGASLQQPPAAVTLLFSEDPEPGLSSIRVLDVDGREVQRGPVQAVPGNPLALRQTVQRLTRGSYTVSWRTVSRVDGHLTAGTIVFGVGTVPPTGAAPPVTRQPEPNPITAIGRWFTYIGLALMLGGAWVWAFAFSGRIPPSRWLYLGPIAALLGTVGIAAGQRADAGVLWGQFFSTFLGRTALFRILPVVGWAVALAIARRNPRIRSAALIAAIALVSTAMLIQVYAGHAGAGGGMAQWIRVVLQWLHLSGVGVWLGGLAALLIGLGGVIDDEKAKATRRYSQGAAVGLAVVLATGVLRAVDAVSVWSALWNMLYGRLVLIKVALLLVLAGLGAINRYRNVPAVRARVQALRRVGAIEVLLALVVLAVTGVLTGVAPPRSLRDLPQPTTLAAAGSDFASTITVRLDVSPGRPGLNRFSVRVADFDTRRPVEADQVELRLSPADRPDIAASTLELERKAPGAFEKEGAGLSLTGPWNIVVNVRRGIDVARVQLRVTLPELQTVRTVTAPGQPTLYTIVLADGRQIQLYMIPPGPGRATVHLTFFDSEGRELSIAETPTITATAEGGEPVVFTPRRLSSGHFLADGVLSAKRTELQILAVSTGGELIRANLRFQPPQ